MLLVVCSCLVCWLGIEGALHLFGITPREVALSKIMTLDEQCGFRLVPNARLDGIPGITSDISINALGMRDRPYNPMPPENTFRILSLGDSFAFGRVADQHNFLTVAEERLNAAFSNKTIEILNTGVPAYQPINEWAYLKAYGLSFKPDLILLCFYVGNDLDDNDKSPLFINPDVSFQKEQEQLQQFPFYRWLGWSRLYQMGINFKIKLALNADIQKRMATIPDRTPPENAYLIPEFWFMDQTQYDNVLKIQTTRYLAESARTQVDQQRIASTQKVLLDIQSLCRDVRGGLVVALLPAEAQVDSAVQARLLVLAAPQWDPNDFDFSQPQTTLKTWLTAQGIPTIDFLPAFQEQAKTRPLYLLRDTHWNESGNHLAADELVPFLSNQIDALM